MEYKIFLDTDCIIDYLTNRHVRADYVYDVMLLAKERDVAISTLTVANAHYVAKIKPQNRSKFEKFVMSKDLVELSRGILENAFSKSMKDFEDAIQLASAESISADYLLTWNTKDYKGQKSLVRIMTPKKFASLLG